MPYSAIRSSWPAIASRGRVKAMIIGVVYPQTELGGDPAALDRIGRAVEGIGFDHLVLYDHVVGAAPAVRDMLLNGPYTMVDLFTIRLSRSAIWPA